MSRATRSDHNATDTCRDKVVWWVFAMIAQLRSDGMAKLSRAALSSFLKSEAVSSAQHVGLGSCWPFGCGTFPSKLSARPLRVIGLQGRVHSRSVLSASRMQSGVHFQAHDYIRHSVRSWLSGPCLLWEYVAGTFDRWVVTKEMSSCSPPNLRHGLLYRPYFTA